ncbi:MAG: dihydrofolate reductase family protein [Solirubrobacterales bacterium]
MNKIILSGNVTIDGYIEDSDGNFGFTEPDEQVHRYWNEIVGESGAQVMGRRLYETMEPFWSDTAANPTGTGYVDEFAKAWVETPRYVVSRTLKTAGNGVELLGDDLEAEITRIRESSDGNVDLGGPTLGNSLAELGLVDQLRMLVLPVAVGSGKPFLGPAFATSRWTLLEQRTFGSSTLLRYEKA